MVKGMPIAISMGYIVNNLASPLLLPLMALAKF